MPVAAEPFSVITDRLGKAAEQIELAEQAAATAAVRARVRAPCGEPDRDVAVVARRKQRQRVQDTQHLTAMVQMLADPNDSGREAPLVPLVHELLAACGWGPVHPPVGRRLMSAPVIRATTPPEAVQGGEQAEQPAEQLEQCSLGEVLQWTGRADQPLPIQGRRATVVVLHAGQQIPVSRFGTSPNWDSRFGLALEGMLQTLAADSFIGRDGRLLNIRVEHFDSGHGEPSGVATGTWAVGATLLDPSVQPKGEFGGATLGELLRLSAGQMQRQQHHGHVLMEKARSTGLLSPSSSPPPPGGAPPHHAPGRPCTPLLNLGNSCFGTSGLLLAMCSVREFVEAVAGHHLAQPISSGVFAFLQRMLQNEEISRDQIQVLFQAFHEEWQNPAQPMDTWDGQMQQDVFEFFER